MTNRTVSRILRTASTFARRGHPASGILLRNQSTDASSMKIAQRQRHATVVQRDLNTAQEDTMVWMKNTLGNVLSLCKTIGPVISTATRTACKAFIMTSVRL